MAVNEFEAVDSEIALTALLAAGVTAYPVSTVGLYPLLKLIAFSLLVLTLLRRMAVMHGMSTDSAILRTSTHLMDVATYISFLYLVYVFVEGIALSSVAPEFLPHLFGATTIFFAFGLFLAWEVAYRGPLEEGERVFEEFSKKHQGEVLGVVLSGMAAFVHSRRFVDEGVTEQVSLTEFENTSRDIEDYSSEEKVQVGLSILLFLFILVTSIVAYISLFWISGFLFGGGWLIHILLLISTLVVSGVVRIWYSNYGIVKVEDRNGFLTFSGEAITYLLLGTMLLS